MIDRSQRNVALLVAGCFFMENLDGTIVTTAAPRIGADLHVAPTAVGLVITAYLITLAVLIPLSGWLVARFGTRTLFLSAIVLFTFASLMCATSVSLGELVAMRVLQGAGGAMMVPVGRLALLSKTAKPDIMRMISYIVWPGLAAPVIAPLIGGVIVTYASWRWLFLINLPLGVIAFTAAVRLIPSTPRGPASRLDWRGVLLTCSGLGALTYTAALASDPSAPWAPVAILGTVSAVILVITVWHLLRAPAPLIDLRTLHVRSLRISMTGGSVFRVTFGAVPFLLPLLFQNIFGWSPIKSGAVVLFVFIGNIAIKPATTGMLNRFGFRRVLIWTTTGLTATVVATGLVTRATPLIVIMAVALLSGVARSVGATAYVTLGFSDIPESLMAHANSLSATAQQLSAGFGIAAATLALRAGTPLADALSRHPTRATGYTIAFMLLAALSLISIAGAARLHPDAGSAVRTIRRKATT
jgi:EmrB/QacA subfamily drug resistance transporter